MTWCLHGVFVLRETFMSFNVVESTGWLAGRNSNMESCNSLVSLREPDKSLVSRASSDAACRLCLALTGMEEHEEDWEAQLLACCEHVMSGEKGFRCSSFMMEKPCGGVQRSVGTILAGEAARLCEKVCHSPWLIVVFSLAGHLVSGSLTWRRLESLVIWALCICCGLWHAVCVRSSLLKRPSSVPASHAPPPL